MVEYSEEISPLELLRSLKEEFPVLPAALQERQRVTTADDSLPAAEMKIVAHHIVDSVLQEKTEEFSAFFEFVEKFVIFGNPDVQDLLITGFLEELKNHSCAVDLDPAVFEEWLGPESHLAWRWLEKKWRGKTSLAGAAKKIQFQAVPSERTMWVSLRDK